MKTLQAPGRGSLDDEQWMDEIAAEEVLPRAEAKEREKGFGDERQFNLFDTLPYWW